MTAEEISKLPPSLRNRARRVKAQLLARGMSAERVREVALGLAQKWAFERAPHHRGVVDDE